MAKTNKDDMEDILAAFDNIEKNKSKKKSSQSDDEITDKDIEDVLAMLEDSGDNDSQEEDSEEEDYSSDNLFDDDDEEEDNRKTRHTPRRKEENYFMKHPFLSIMSGLVLIAATIINIKSPGTDMLERGFIIILALILVWWIMRGNKCPKCGEPHAMKVISKTPIHSSATYSKKDSDGKYYTYHKVTERVTRQCKHCSHRTEKQEEREEKLA